MKWPLVLRLSLKLFPALAVAGLGIGAAIWTGSDSRRAAELPVLHEVPPFSLEERSGRTLRREDLLGRVWIADFIFTNCAGTCPAMTAQMGRVQAALGRAREEVLLVSISVDPERDNREALSAYAERSRAGKGWLFLRGPREVVGRLSREGFLLGASGGAADPGTEPIAHSSRFALVDRRGRIRGYYDGTEPAIVDRLSRDARALLTEGAR